MKVLILGAIAALSIALSPGALADPEADFNKALTDAGFKFDGGGRTNSVKLGYWICENLGAGYSPGSLFGSIQESSTRLDGTMAPAVIIDTAVHYLCPEHSDLV